jgi:Carboxypeptidase regulatory-like domain
MTRIIRVIAAFVLCAGIPAIGGAQVPSRTDAPTTGTAQIRGRVFDLAAGKPLRRAQIRLNSADYRQNFVTASDEQGRYEFKELPAGRYSLSVSKGGYVTLSYGQTRPFESGRPVELHDTQILEKVDFSLPRGAVVTGRLVDEFGDPAPNVQVTVMRYTFVQGQKRLTPTGGADTTNDLGEFRLFGLPPGQFYICGTSRPNVGLGPADDDRAGYAPTYYPGVTNPSEAQRLTIGLGQARPDVNFALVPTRTARVSGTAVDSRGRPITNGPVTIYQLSSMIFNTQSVIVRPDGTFVINGLTPGDYQLRAQSMTANDGSRDIAMAQITVNGDDIADVRLVADAPVAVSGRVVLDPAAAGSLAPSAFRVSTWSMPTSTMTMSFGGVPAAQVQEDWTFTTKAVPGRNRMAITTPPGWSMKAVRLNGADVTDSGIDVKRNQEVRNIEIEVTNHPATLSGTVTNNRGDVPADYMVVVFARDEQRWTPGTRYILTARPDQNGQFKVSPTPPGDYLAAAFEYIEPGQSGDPDFLKQIRDRATAFSLGDGEAKTLRLKLIAQP